MRSTVRMSLRFSRVSGSRRCPSRRRRRSRRCPSHSWRRRRPRYRTTGRRRRQRAAASARRQAGRGPGGRVVDVSSWIPPSDRAGHTACEQPEQTGFGGRVHKIGGVFRPFDCCTKGKNRVGGKSRRLRRAFCSAARRGAQIVDGQKTAWGSGKPSMWSLVWVGGDSVSDMPSSGGCRICRSPYPSTRSGGPLAVRTRPASRSASAASWVMSRMRRSFPSAANGCMTRALVSGSRPVNGSSSR